MKKKTRILILLPGHGKKEQFDRAPEGQSIELVQEIIANTPENIAIEYLDTVPEIPRTGVKVIDKFISNVGAFSRLPTLINSDVIISSDTGIAQCLASFFRAKWFFIPVNTSVTSRRLQKNPLRLRILRFCWRQCTEILCLAHSQTNDFLAAGVSRERLAYMPLGVDEKFFNFADNKNDGDYIVSVGFDLGRDYDYLLCIAEHVPYKIAIIASEKNIPKDTVLPSNVTVRYNISISEFRECTAAARIMIIPTKENANEGSDCSGQTVILQALAMGKPVCATVQPWMSEYLEEEKEFIALPSGDVLASAKIISDLWEDSDRRAKLAYAGRETIEKKYTLSIWAKAILERVGLSNSNKYPADN